MIRNRSNGFVIVLLMMLGSVPRNISPRVPIPSLSKKMSDLKSVLTQATSLDTIERTKAMDLLGKWEIEPMYHVALLVIDFDKEHLP